MPMLFDGGESKQESDYVPRLRLKRRRNTQPSSAAARAAAVACVRSNNGRSPSSLLQPRIEMFGSSTQTEQQQLSQVPYLDCDFSFSQEEQDENVNTSKEQQQQLSSCFSSLTFKSTANKHRRLCSRRRSATSSSSGSSSSLFVIQYPERN
jgi:hypothetical protein